MTPTLPATRRSGASAGPVDAPVFLFDEVRVPTQQGVDLVWTDLQWLVLDIVDGSTECSAST